MTDKSDWRDMFEGRDADLEWFRTKWPLIKIGLPQFEVIVGPTGVGKTRLVQEFYRWLSRTQDPPQTNAPEGYWPDTILDATNSSEVHPPVPDGFHIGRPEIPWLWWGVKATADALSYPPFPSADAALFSHVDQILASRKLSEMTKDRMKALRSVLSESAISLLDLILTAGIADVMVILSNLIRAIRGDKTMKQELEVRAGESPAVAALRVINNRYDLIFAILEMLMEPEVSDAPPIPVVLVVDDAQYLFNADESQPPQSAIEFLQKIWKRARERKWPLMIIATHWDDHWEKHRLAMKPHESPRSLIHLLSKLGLPDEPGVVRRLEKLPANSLCPVTERALPGLTDDQRQVVLSRADGHPRLLGYYLGEMLETPAWFEDSNFSSRLTQNGNNQVQQLSTEEHIALRRRIKMLEPKARDSLGWNSMQGTRFLVQVSAAVADEIDEPWTAEEFEAGLELSRPERLVESLSESGRFIHGQFRQAAYHEVALEIFNSDDPDRSESVLAGIKRLLTNWIINGKADAFDSTDFQQAERLDVLVMARRHLASDVPDQPDNAHKAWCLGMLQLFQLYRDQNLWEQARDVADMWIRSSPTGWPPEWVDPLDQVAVCSFLQSFLQSVSNFVLIDTFVEKLAERCQEEAISNRSVETLRRAAAVLSYSGVIQRLRERPMQALEIEQRSTQMRECIIEEFGSRCGLLHDFAISLQRLGDLQRDTGEPDVAKVTFEKGVSISDRNLSSYGMRIESIRDSIGFLVRLGGLVAKSDHRELAIPYFERASHLISRAIPLFPGEADLVCDHCSLLLQNGETRMLLNDHEGAIQQFESAITLEHQLIERRFRLPKTMSELSILLLKKGTSYFELDNHPKAIATLCESERVCRQRREAFGASVSVRRDLSVVLERKAIVELNRKNGPAAKSDLVECVALRKGILTEAENSHEAIRQTAVAEMYLAICVCTEGHTNDASHHLKSGLERLDAIFAAGVGTSQDAARRETIRGILEEVKCKGCPSATHI